MDKLSEDTPPELLCLRRRGWHPGDRQMVGCEGTEAAPPSVGHQSRHLSLGRLRAPHSSVLVFPGLPPPVRCQMSTVLGLWGGF